MTGEAWRLAMAAKEPDQAGRLREFRDEHPATEIRPAEFGGACEAWIPARRGSRAEGRLVVGRTLRELLDKLEKIAATGPEPDTG